MLKKNNSLDEEFIVNSIKVIDEQIEYFEKRINLFCCRNKKEKYNKRIYNLNCIKTYLYKKLER